MKIAKLFRPFLELKHYLILPSIGKLEVVSAEINPLTGKIEKNFIRFREDKNISPDPEFLEYVSRHLKADACISTADLQCFCNSTNELLIQGFEVEIPAIGFLHMESGNQLKFSGKSIYKSAAKELTPKPAIFLTASFWL
ncbi:MAG TPA: hypothetical protein VI548_03140 [Chitinophagaceae bacterium]|nr:hypothetical protein [Chitinophagaceae bacterium]